MKLGNATSTEVEGSDTSTQHDFRISDANSAHIFNMLTSYSDPIGSVVREITSNCFDAHRKADVDKDVVIRMTRGSRLDGTDAQIQFEDFGTGLTPKMVEEIFTVLGESTKRDSNDAMGAFGIGAKSPFGYLRDNDLGGFTVDTYVDGTHWEYFLAESVEGPAMTQMVEEPTDRENGTIVTVPIASGDFYKFKRAIRKELAYFDNINFEISGIENDYTIYRGENFVYRPNNNPYDEIHACFGKVAYPLDFDKLDWDKGGYGNRKLHAPIALHFDIGEIQVVPNREQINYTDETIEAINSKVEDVQEEFQKLWNDQYTGIEDIKDLLRARKNASNSKVTVKGVDIPFSKKILPNPSIKMDKFDLDLPDNIFYNFEVYKVADSDGYIKSGSRPPSIRSLLQGSGVLSHKEIFLVEDKYSPKTNRYIASRYGRNLTRDFYLAKKISHGSVNGKYIIDDPTEEDWEPDDDVPAFMNGGKPPLDVCEKPEIHKARMRYDKFWCDYNDDSWKTISESKLKEVIEFEELVEEYIKEQLDDYSDIEPTEDFEEWEKKKREQKEKQKKEKRENEFPIKILDTDDSGWGNPDYKWSMDDMEYDSLNNNTLYIYGFQDDSDDLLDIAPLIYSNDNFFDSSGYGGSKLDRDRVAVLKIAMKREYLFEDLDNAYHISEFQKGYHIIDRAYHYKWIDSKISGGRSDSENTILTKFFPEVTTRIGKITHRINPYTSNRLPDDPEEMGVELSEDAEKNYIYNENEIKWLEASHDAMRDQLPLIENMKIGGYITDINWDEFEIYMRAKDLVHPKLWAKKEGIID